MILDVRGVKKLAKTRTLLGVACEMGNYNAVKILIEKGADVNEKNYRPPLNRETTPLLDVCLSRTKDDSFHIVHDLVEAGADVDGEDSFGNTPLIYISNRSPFRDYDDSYTGKDDFVASGYIDQQIINYLLQEGADVNHNNDKGECPLVASVWGVNLDTFKSLMQRHISKDSVEKALNEARKSLNLYNEKQRHMQFKEQKVKALEEMVKIMENYK
jgi:ankyrin repeat protein